MNCHNQFFYISEFESTDQSDENCISGKSIDKCWFSLSKVFPGVSANLSVSYEDNTVSNRNMDMYITQIAIKGDMRFFSN